MSSDLCYLSVRELVEGYRAKSFSPVEVTAAALARIEALNPKVNAFFFVDDDGAGARAKESESRWARGEPLGLLDGVPVGVKDHILTTDMPSPWASTVVDMAGPWTEDAPICARLKEHGAIVLGKTTMPEMAAFCSCVSSLYGVGRNPWDLSRTPGGSSGGSAAALATGMAALTIGSDAGGSIRIPASYTGVFGLKPTWGRIPFYPPMGPGPVYGPMTRNVSDAALVMNVVCAPDWRDVYAGPYDGRDYLAGLEDGIAGAHVGYWPAPGYGQAATAEVLGLVGKAVANLETLGAEVRELPPLFDYDVYAALAPGALPGLAMLMTAMAGGRFDELAPELRAMLDKVGAVTTEQFMAAMALQTQVCLQVAEMMKDLDYVVTPTMATPAFEAEKMFPDDVELNQYNYTMDHNPFTWLFNLTQHPAASINCGFSNRGLPIGLQFVGRRHDDFGVLKAARAYEMSFPTVREWPELAA